MRCDVKVGTLQHYKDVDGSLRSCDTTVQQDAGKVFVDWLPYKFKLHDNGIGFNFQSRESGLCSVTLTGVGGKPFDDKKKLTPTIEGDKITFSEVVPGLDIVFRVLPARVKSWRIVKDEAAPRTFEWLCEHDKDGREKISDKLVGKDAEGNQLELAGEAVPIDATSFRFVETWTGKVKVRDKKTRIKSLSDIVTYPVSIDPTVNESIATDDNDIYELGSGAAQIANGYSLQLGSSANFATGLRFTSLGIPSGSTIDSATLTVNLVGGGIYYQEFNIFGYDTGSASAWSQGSIGPAFDAHTTASTNVPEPISTGIKNYDVTTIIQELVNRGDWTSGNNISIELIPTTYVSYGHRCRFEEYNNAGTNEASLSITYTAPVSSTNVVKIKRGTRGLIRGMRSGT